MELRVDASPGGAGAWHTLFPARWLRGRRSAPSPPRVGGSGCLYPRSRPRTAGSHNPETTSSLPNSIKLIPWRESLLHDFLSINLLVRCEKLSTHGATHGFDAIPAKSAALRGPGDLDPMQSECTCIAGRTCKGHVLERISPLAPLQT